MSNPQALPEAGVCAECGRRLTRSGVCWFNGSHSQIREFPGIPGLVEVDVNSLLEGEIVEVAEQLSLSEDLFERYEVETVAISVSGIYEVQADMLGMIAAEGLEPGQDVVIVCRGHVKDVSTPYKVKHRKCSGRLVLGVEIVESVREVSNA